MLMVRLRVLLASYRLTDITGAPSIQPVNPGRYTHANYQKVDVMDLVNRCIPMFRQYHVPRQIIALPSRRIRVFALGRSGPLVECSTCESVNAFYHGAAGPSYFIGSAKPMSAIGHFNGGKLW